MKFIGPALRILSQYKRNPEANLKLLLSRFLDKSDAQEREEITRTVYGVVRKEIALEQTIRRFIRRNPADPAVTLCLKIAVFLLIYSDSYPPYAVVNETVKLAAKPFRPLVNAVLRRMAEQREGLRRSISGHEDLSTRHSLTPALIGSLKRITPEPEEALAYLDSEPVFHLLPNPRRLTAAQARDSLARKGIPFRELPGLGSFEIKRMGGAGQKMVRQGYFYVQNTAAQLVAIVAARFASRRIFDAAAAPGSKSITLSFIRPELPIMASDIRIGRLRIMQNNLKALGISRGIHLFAADLLHFPIRFQQNDMLLLDLPCTSSGTLRKNPDLKTKITEKSIMRMADQQRRTLEAFLPLLKKTHLLYAVCSFTPAETEDMLAGLVGLLHAESVDLSAILDEYGFKYRKETWGHYLLPSALNNDLFYISLLRAQ